MENGSVILSSLDDVPAPPVTDRLLISGCSVVSYHAHRLASPTRLAEAFELGTLASIDDDRSYASKVRPGSGLEYSAFVDAGPVPAALTRIVHSNHAARLQQSVLWLGEEYVVSAIPFFLSVRRPDRAGIELTAPLTVDGLLRFLGLLAEPAIARSVGEQAAAALARRLGLRVDEIERTWPVTGSFGIQIWNLDGTTGRDTAKLYEGSKESAEYSWEISAILSYSSDHFKEDGLWRRRSRQQIYSTVRSGSGFFDDHMVFVNADCCLEMAHLPAWLRDRSDFRLTNYGYDSSSIFVWSISMLRTAIAEDLSQRYREAVVDLIARRQITVVEQAEMTRLHVRHSRLLDRIVTFRDQFVEARNRALDEQITTYRSGSRATSALLRHIDRYSALAMSLYRVHEETERSRRDALIAMLAVVLAVVQVPGFVEQIADWADAGTWVRLGISATLIVLPLVLLWRVLRRTASG
ncbi:MULTISPECIES: hypothetical protein [Micromonospora]|uniref:Uncharacterized protein n=1 Tax=Micromonospora chalcea TaxID=1874 RepID=A0ABX9Y6F6_MICCH|nr:MULTISPECIES: hypothetical protein [Micromonospora]NHO80544.1 hypothetical protein [Micromonospora sp. CMU55-4]ODB81597.1 hypothetical protein A8711_14170 [Micromonospora sp. II]RQW94677.1 hypothetical protein DLJ60_08595 [Micromonospora chalcea]RQX49505.1 hypothetical protein DLJ57_11230 [Micromonospora chalcea]WBB83985.1 hypothetical protein O7542_21890 [Micromonospora sp. WMMC264]